MVIGEGLRNNYKPDLSWRQVALEVLTKNALII